MPAPDIHSRTHLPGGIDPLAMNLSFARAASSTGGNQTVDNLAIPFDSFFTNDATVFEQSVDGDGIIVKEKGFYLVAGAIGSSDTNATMYTQAQPEASYPTFGTEWGWGFAAQPFAFDTSLITATKSRRNHFGFGTMFASGAAPYKVIVASAKRTPGGANVSYTFAGLVVVKIASL